MLQTHIGFLAHIIPSFILFDLAVLTFLKIIFDFGYLLSSINLLICHKELVSRCLTKIF